MTNDIKSSLEQINEVSRQLLSRMLSLYNQSQVSPESSNELLSDESTSNSEILENKLTDLMANRDSLVRSLFEKNTHEEITKELNLLNEMISLDSELSKQSKAYKQLLAEQVIKLKKSKKVSKSYQKY
ncbi:hypothetical protein [Colwellia psychrerythraea]|uniref:Flagellar protein FliT n=1 Tax=Colwellia psychrerythraea TaxID=28229 RepID=A0A099KLP9_COLPS|nr:hypothetical protein [Colwellia psychrerythraea]KGJ91391.1 hypothetical protein ND2E_3256 [Colwellia psychrerythraea]